MYHDSSPLITVRVAEAPDTEAIQRCRFDIYSEEGFIDVSKFPDGMEYDEYDNHSVSVIASAGAGIDAIGTTRVIIKDGFELPIQKHPHFAWLPQERSACEISRLCVRKGFRDGKISLAMYRVLFHIIQSNGIEDIYAIVDEEFFATLCWIGFPFERIGESKEYMGLTVPTRCVTDQVIPALKESENANLLGVTSLFERPYPGKLIL